MATSEVNLKSIMAMIELCKSITTSQVPNIDKLRPPSWTPRKSPLDGECFGWKFLNSLSNLYMVSTRDDLWKYGKGLIVPVVHHKHEAYSIGKKHISVKTIFNGATGVADKQQEGEHLKPWPLLEQLVAQRFGTSVAVPVVQAVSQPPVVPLVTPTTTKVPDPPKPHPTLPPHIVGEEKFVEKPTVAAQDPKLTPVPVVSPMAKVGKTEVKTADSTPDNVKSDTLDHMICREDAYGNVLKWPTRKLAARACGMSLEELELCLACGYQYKWYKRPPVAVRKIHNGEFNGFRASIDGEVWSPDGSKLNIEINKGRPTVRYNQRKLVVALIVCTAFHDHAPFNQARTVHLDGDERNVRPDNLEWGAKNSGGKILCFRDGELIKTYPSISRAAKMTDIAVASISRCCQGKRKTAGGFVWEKEQRKK